MIKRFAITGLLLLLTGINIWGQNTNSKAEWEVGFGKSWGRFHQNVVKQTVSSNGQTTFLNVRNGTPRTGKVSQKDIDELTGLINRLKIAQAKPIPSGEFNRCIVSMHLPNIYFSLTINGQTYRFSHCNRYSDNNWKYEYTLNLSNQQKTIYKTLRSRLESLFANEKTEQTQTSEQTGINLSIENAKILTIFEYFNHRDLQRKAVWKGKLTRRGDTNIFDAVWRNTKTGKVLRETIEVVNELGEEVVLKRKGPEIKNLRNVFRGRYNSLNPAEIICENPYEENGWMWYAVIEK